MVLQIRNHAERHGFKVVASQMLPDDVDLKFKRNNQELEISIEQKEQGIIEYKAELEQIYFLLVREAECAANS